MHFPNRSLHIVEQLSSTVHETLAGPNMGKSASASGSTGRFQPHIVGKRRAFTLVELMVVLVIIALLSGVVTLSVRGYLLTSKQNIAKVEISKLIQALDTFTRHLIATLATKKGWRSWPQGQPSSQKESLASYRKILGSIRTSIVVLVRLSHMK